MKLFLKLSLFLTLLTPVANAASSTVVNTAVEDIISAIQRTDYYPSGLPYPSMLNPQEQPYKFNGKEFDTMHGLNMYDYSARHYDAAIARWHVPDPLAEKYYSISPYAYCANNPVRFIDPTGKAIDDYFNYDGKFLGTDNAVTDNVRIISQEDWDKNKIEVDGVETIESKTGISKSELFSASRIKDNNVAVLNVYDHYNPTGVRLDIIDDGDGGMQYFASRNEQKINIRTMGNFESKLSDHANEIINMFSHEESHHNDYLSDKNRFFTMSLYIAETTATAVQMQHPSFLKTRMDYRKKVMEYWMKFGPFMPIENNIMKYMNPIIPKTLHLRP